MSDVKILLKDAEDRSQEIGAFKKYLDYRMVEIGFEQGADEWNVLDAALYIAKKDAGKLVGVRP